MQDEPDESGRSCVVVGRSESGSTSRRLGPDRSVHRATSRPVEVTSSRPQRCSPNQAVSTSGWRPSGPGRDSDEPAARWGFCATSAARGRGVAGRPTYDGPDQAPGAGGIGSQPSGTTSTTATNAVTAPATQPTTRRLTWVRSCTHHRTRGTQSASRRDQQDDRPPGDPEEQERTDQPDHRATLGEPPTQVRGGATPPRPPWCSAGASLDGADGRRWARSGSARRRRRGPHRGAGRRASAAGRGRASPQPR